MLDKTKSMCVIIIIIMWFVIMGSWKFILKQYTAPRSVVMDGL